MYKDQYVYEEQKQNLENLKPRYKLSISSDDLKVLAKEYNEALYFDIFNNKND